MPDPATLPLKPEAKFGRRTGKPRPIPRRASFRISPTLLASALYREKPNSLRRLVLERLYQNMTPAEKRLCDGVRAKMADVPDGRP